TAEAQQEADTSLFIEEIEITNNRITTRIGQESRSIQILTKEEIKNLPAKTLPELLQFLPGLDVRRRGVDGVQADISMRGGSFDQVLILINGVKMSDPQTGHHTAYIPVDLDDIERVEIIKGPASRLY